MQDASMAVCALRTLTPDAALLLLTCGLLLIYVELNRPGWIVAGALGLLTTLLALATLAGFRLNGSALALICAAAAVWLLNLVRPVPLAALIAATLALILGFVRLTVHGSGPLQVQPAVAVVCGLTIGVPTSLLTHIARRARSNKRVRL
jgi:membrane-bound serine protease (ClpP class)